VPDRGRRRRTAGSCAAWTELKPARAANDVRALRAELLAVSRSMGVTHPALLTPENVEVVGERYETARVGA
jgi:hypothetical protein